MEKEGQYEKGFFLDFLMGPSIKFVLAIVDAFSNKKMGVNFFHRKKTKPGGGGSEGGLAKDHTFSGFFFRLPSLYGNLCTSARHSSSWNDGMGLDWTGMTFWVIPWEIWQGWRGSHPCHCSTGSVIPFASLSRMTSE